MPALRHVNAISIMVWHYVHKYDIVTIIIITRKYFTAKLPLNLHDMIIQNQYSGYFSPVI